MVVIVHGPDGAEIGQSWVDGQRNRTADEALRSLGYRRDGDGSTAEPVDSIRFDDDRFAICVTRAGNGKPRRIFLYAGMDEHELNTEVARALSAGLAQAADLAAP